MRCVILFLLIQVLPLKCVEFRSLWLDSKRTSWPQLQSSLECDVAIVGAGISGVATLYSLLTSTEKKVALFERDFVASGATGHNGGLPTVHIERPVSSLVEEFGLEPVKQVYNEIDSGQQQLFDMAQKIGFELFPIPMAHIGFPSISTLVQFLEENQLSSQVGPRKWTYWVIDDEKIKQQIPSRFHPLLQWVSQEQILNVLEVRDASCIGVASETRLRVRMNSALFCDQILQYLARTYPDRCQIYEKSEITQIDLRNDEQILHHPFGTISTKNVVLCTNAYTDFMIRDERTGRDVTKLKEQIIQREGFLAAYPSSSSHSSLIGFLSENETIPYWYFSAAPLSQSKNETFSILGGPEYTLSAPLTPEETIEKGEESQQLMKEFLNSTSPFPYFWHGTMAYTQNGLRWVGEDRDHPHLWYNLGCNGIGILQAIAGAQKIARQMKGESFGPSLFDPPIYSSPPF